MKNFTQDNVTEAILDRISSSKDPRFREVMTSLVTHLHAFARDVDLREGEWFEGIKFLTETGQKCDDVRQEFILLSDTLGLSMLVVGLNHPKPTGATEPTVFGPFFRDGAPDIKNGDSIVRGDGGKGEVTLMRGRVTGPDGKPIAGALLDIWQTAPNGLYETQDENQADYNFRGRLRSDKDGYYAFVTMKPVSYSIPTDGPVGRMLKAMNRHSMRPAHVHFVVSHPGFEPVTTHVFASGDEYLDSDAVFGVRSSLVADFKPCSDEALAKKYGLKTPFLLAEYDFGLALSQKQRAAE